MLPFLKRKETPQVGVIVKQRAPDASKADETDDKDASIHACAQDLINAIHSKDVAGVAEALRSALDVLQGNESESYDAQNELAAQGEIE